MQADQLCRLQDRQRGGRRARDHRLWRNHPDRDLCHHKVGEHPKVDILPQKFCFRDKKLVQEELTKALEVLIENDVDMILVEYFFYIQEMEWAIELCRKVQRQIFQNMPIAIKLLSTTNLSRQQWQSDQRVTVMEFLPESAQSGNFPSC